MKFRLLIIALLLCNYVYSQISVSKNLFFAKTWSKDISLYKAKSFVIDQVLGINDESVKFEIDPLVASNSGELTTLVYKCAQKNKEGLIFGFFGETWNSAGVIYTGYAFKEIAKDEAIRLLERIKKEITDNAKYLEKDKDNNNIYFQVGDMTFLIYMSDFITKIRVFWNGFDAEWDYSSLNKTEKHFLKKLER